MRLVVARSLVAISIKHLPEAMFIKAKIFDRIVAFKPRDIPLPGDRSCVPHFFQLIGKAVELLRVQIGVIAPLRQHMLNAGKLWIGARHDLGS